MKLYVHWRIQDSPRGGANSQMYCRKLHENERIWTPTGVVPGALSLGSANLILNTILIKKIFWLLKLSPSNLLDQQKSQNGEIIHIKASSR